MADIQFIGGSARFTDNENLFVQELLTIILYSDANPTVKMCKKPDEIIAHIIPSDIQFKEKIVQNLLWINRTMKLRIRYSSSLGISRTISFRMPLDNSTSLVSLCKQ